MQSSHRVAMPQHAEASGQAEHSTSVGNDVNTAIGMQLAQARRRSRLTRANVAFAMDLTEADIADYERGAERPTPRMIARFAAILGCSIESLFRSV